MHLDIFNDDAFSLSQLTVAINDLPKTYNRIAEMGLFRERGITTTTASIERQGHKLSLVDARPRGAPGKPYTPERGKLIALKAIHLPSAPRCWPMRCRTCVPSAAKPTCRPS